MSRSELLRIAAQVLPSSGCCDLERTESGGSTPVYRMHRAGTILYLRLSESATANLAPEVFVHTLLRTRGVRVPEIVFFESSNEILARSVIVTTEIPGEPIGRCHSERDIARVLAAAGRDLALINQVAVEGFGWVRRDMPGSPHLAAEHPTLRAFAHEEIETHLTALTNVLSPKDIDTIRETISTWDGFLDTEQGVLAHGDFDVSHIYHVDGEYTGIIDCGEIRGTDQFYDLGHYALHDGETLPFQTLPHLLAGYGEVAPLPPDHRQRIAMWSLLIGARALARSLRRPPSRYQEHLVRAMRFMLEDESERGPSLRSG